MTKIIILGADVEPLASVSGAMKNAPAVAAAEASKHKADQRVDHRIMGQFIPSSKQFSTMRAQLALAGGYELRHRKHPDGLMLFEVGRHGGWRVFSMWSDVQAFAASVRARG